jgi:hypothetical protein
MRAREVGLTLKAWAQENRLMSDEIPLILDEEVDADVRDAVFQSSAVSALSQTIFRNRGINAIGFNNVTNEVIVFTHRAIPAKELKVLPDAVHQEVAISYVHGGMAQASPPTGTAQSPYVMRNGKFACGGSIHPAKVIGAGTLGCLVKDAAGELYGLTNNHVGGMCNYAQLGEKIIAPGHPDISTNGIDPFTIGYHFRALPMVQGRPDNVDIALNRDASLIKIADPDRVSSMQGGMYDTPSAVLSLCPNLTVEKVGRTTGHTRGVVRAQIIGAHGCSYSVQGFGSHISFFDPVFVVHGLNGPFSQPGDSGSLVTAELNGDRYAVGIVFAGDPQGQSFILPLDVALANLGVELVTGHNI